MADRRLRAILEFMVTGEKRVENAMKGVSTSTSRAAIQQGVMAQRSQLLSNAQQRLSKRVLAGNLSIEKASAIYKRYERSLPTDALKGLETQTTSTQTGLDRVQSAFGKVAIGAAAAGAAIFTAKKVFDFAQEGAQILQVEDSFDRMNQTVFKTPGLLDEMRQAVRGTIGDTQLMGGVLTLVAGTSDEMARSLAEGAPKLLEIAKAAQKLNPTLGDTAFLYQSLSLGIKRQSKLIIDNLGLNVSLGTANQKYADALGKTVEQLSDAERFQAFYNEVLEAGDTLIEQVGGNVDSLTDSYEAATVAIKGFVDEAKKGVAEALLFNVIGLKDTEQQWNDLREALIRTGASWGDINDIVGEGRAKLDLWRTEADFKRDLDANTEGIDRMAFAIEALNKGLKIGTDDFNDYIEAQEKQGKASEEQIAAARAYAEGLITVNERLGALKKAVDDGVISQGQLNDVYYDTGFSVQISEAALSDLESQMWQNLRVQQHLALETEATAKLMESGAGATDEFTEAQLRNKRALESGTDALYHYSRKLNLNKTTIDNLIRVYGDEAAVVEYLIRVLQDAGQATDDFEISQHELGTSTDDTTAAIGQQADAFRRIVSGGLTLFNEELDELGPTMIMVGGRTADQNRLFEEARDRSARLGREIADLSAGFGAYGMDAEQVAKRIGELSEEQDYYNNLAAQYSDIQGTAQLITREATLNYDAMSEALFKTVMAGSATKEQMAAMGLALGELTQQQADTILKNIDLEAGIIRIKDEYIAQGLSAGEAKKALQILSDEGIVAMNAFIDEALIKLEAKLDRIRQQIDDMPTYKRIEFEIAVTGDDPRTAIKELPWDVETHPDAGEKVTPKPPPPYNPKEEEEKYGGQHGLDMMVPPGYPNDSFPVWASSGERVIIQTPQQQSAFSNSFRILPNAQVQPSGGGNNVSFGDINIFVPEMMTDLHLIGGYVANSIGDRMRG